MALRRMGLIWVALTAVAVGCSSGTTPTSSPTAAARQPTSAATPAATASPKASASPAVASPTAATSSITLPTRGPIDSIQQCVDENALVSRLDLPRQIVSVTPASIRDGTSVTITAMGYRPNTALEVRTFIAGTNRISQPLGQTLATESGRATMTFTIPSVKMLNVPGDSAVPVCIGFVLWSPTESGGALSFVVPER